MSSNLIGVCLSARGRGERKLLALASKERLVKILEKMLDEDEFFSEHGIRSVVSSLASYCVWMLMVG